MCTVTRPGNAFVAASLAVELMVSIFQHPLQVAYLKFLCEPSNKDFKLFSITCSIFKIFALSNGWVKQSVVAL